MSTMPPRSRMRSRLARRKRSSWAAESVRKEARSMPASMAISPSSAALRSSVIGRPPCARSRVEFEIGSHPLAEEHGVVAFEHPLPGTVADGTGTLVRLQAVDGLVVRQLQQDHVIEVPAIRDVVPAQEAHPELLLIPLDLLREQLL